MRHFLTLTLALFFTTATFSISMATERPSPHFASGGTFSGDFVINRITDPLNGIADTNAFNELMGHNLRFVIVFNSIAKEVSALDIDGNQRWVLTTGQVQTYFFGDETGYLRSIVAPALNAPLLITLHEDADGTTFLDGFCFSGAETPQYFGLECSGKPLVITTSGSLRAQKAILDGRSIVLQRYITPFAMTDLATGFVEYSLYTDGGPVPTEAKTFSAIKLLYRGQD